MSPMNAAGIQVAVVVVSCSCGNFPLDKAMHTTPKAAWRAAADHVELNPTKCQPTMTRTSAPAGLIFRSAK